MGLKIATAERTQFAHAQEERRGAAFEFNVMKFAGGEMGEANGMSGDGSIIRDNEQAPTVWVGTTFGFAALLLSEGMKEEAYHAAWGLYHVIYENKGYWFRTPEAWDISGNFRASMYMRPAAVWAIEVMLSSSAPMIKKSQSSVNRVEK